MNFPSAIPMLKTMRLHLRHFNLADASEVQRLAGEREVAEMTAAIPHPYPDGAAEAWIATHPEKWHAHQELIFAITLQANGQLIGSISLTLLPADEKAEMGYWVGIPYWNKGYASEAAHAVIEYGFRVLQLNRIQAHHMATNSASGRVMEKAGMTREGRSLQSIKKGGTFHDAIFYGVVRSDWSELPESIHSTPGLDAKDLRESGR